MKKFVFLTGSRGEWGYIRPILRLIENDPECDYSIIATNMHLLSEFGSSIHEIEKDGFKVEEKIFMTYDGYNSITMAKSLGSLLLELPTVLNRLRPDFLILAGDRGEQLMGAIAAVHMRIPVAHIQAGELSGNVDGIIRHSITKLAHIHFAANEEFAERVKKLGEQDFRIFITGAPLVDELIQENIMKKEELRKNLEALKNYEYNTETLNKELEEIIVEMDKIAKKLDKNRKIASNKMSEEVLNELKKLGFEHPRFSINVSESEEFNQYGKNSVEFLFSANPDTLLKPLRYVASGGEISRIMLSIKKVSNEKNSSTLIFDEIDSGIGGNTAFYVGECLKEISKNKQLLVITHIPQVAVFGDMHFKVEKNYENKKTNVVVKTLINKNERVNEIARMLGSIYSPDTAIKHAEELLKKANT